MTSAVVAVPFARNALRSDWSSGWSSDAGTTSRS
jgi:hypothetical protein